MASDQQPSLTQVKQAFLDALAIGETEPQGRTQIGYGYNKLCGSTLAHPQTFSSYAKFPDWDGWLIPSGDYAGKRSHAAGRYQFEPATWRACADALKLPDFSPTSQDTAAWWLAIHDYSRRSGRNLFTDLAGGANGSLGGVAAYLRETWTSLSVSTFPDRFRSALAALSPEAAPAPAAPAPASVPEAPPATKIADAPAPAAPSASVAISGTASTATIPTGHAAAYGALGAGSLAMALSLIFPDVAADKLAAAAGLVVSGFGFIAHSGGLVGLASAIWKGEPVNAAT